MTRDLYDGPTYGIDVPVPDWQPPSPWPTAADVDTAVAEWEADQSHHQPTPGDRRYV